MPKRQFNLKKTMHNCNEIKSSQVFNPHLHQHMHRGKQFLESASYLIERRITLHEARLRELCSATPVGQSGPTYSVRQSEVKDDTDFYNILRVSVLQSASSAAKGCTGLSLLQNSEARFVSPEFPPLGRDGYKDVTGTGL
ncbi:hypothetical protein E2C01_049874 [Portunus trituberculatus]|uniref:Uncharacterized protein n=1 Tax=Portunus trituberculatus TaxID=210409 RepID=A0A5B7GFH3_PORTR|nr:hypothetical protein [Portunus trituberculatus]